VLTSYLTATQSLLGDTAGQFYTTASLTTFINTARNRIAATGECVRWLPPSGSGQNETVASQEVYPFSFVNTLIPSGSGIGEVLAVRSVAIANGSIKPLWRQMVWTTFQARIRIYNGTFTGSPSVGFWSQFSFGSLGSIYLGPIPSQANPMDWDCTCLPLALNTDADPEAIPYPWTDLVPFYAAYLALLSQQRPADADQMFARMMQMNPWAARVVKPQFVVGSR
jgi:hypothetical protein